MRRVKASLAAVALTASMGIISSGPASADPPGAGDKQCSPGQNNVGGGTGNSGPGDKQGAPLKAPRSCPGR
jgi:hypothetical protein